jgi:hypothetical protein
VVVGGSAAGGGGELRRGVRIGTDDGFVGSNLNSFPFDCSCFGEYDFNVRWVGVVV